jgi:hypothetical protein
VKCSLCVNAQTGTVHRAGARLRRAGIRLPRRSATSTVPRIQHLPRAFGWSTQRGRGPLLAAPLAFPLLHSLFCFCSPLLLHGGLTSHLDAWIKCRASIEPVTPPPTTSTRRVVDSSISRPCKLCGVSNSARPPRPTITHLLNTIECFLSEVFVVVFAPRCVNYFQPTPYLLNTDNITESELEPEPDKTSSAGDTKTTTARKPLSP